MASETVVFEERLELSAEDVQYMCDVLDKMIAAAEESVKRLDRIIGLLEETRVATQAIRKQLAEGEAYVAVQSIRQN
jgi:hypothetical protein